MKGFLIPTEVEIFLSGRGGKNIFMIDALEK
jgi:hypothetical protein